MDSAVEKLRIGILLNDLDVAAWHYAMLEQILHSEDAQIALVVLNDAQISRQSRLAGLRQEWHNLLYLVHQKFEHAETLLAPDLATNKGVIQSLLGKVNAGGCTNLSGGWLEGCKHVKKHASKEQVNRVLLLEVIVVMTSMYLFA